MKQSPGSEFAIMSLCRSDPKFRAICEDFGEAITVLRRFQAQGQSGLARAAEFRRISDDLRLELIDYLNRTTAGRRVEGKP